MMIFLLLLVGLALAGIVFTIVQVVRDGYGHPSTVPSNTLAADDPRRGWGTR